MENKTFTKIYVMTESEYEVYCYIKEYISKKGFSPTVRNISEGCGMSLSWTHKLVKALKSKGYINYVPKTVRTITIRE